MIIQGIKFCAWVLFDTLRNPIPRECTDTQMLVEGVIARFQFLVELKVCIYM